MREDITEQSRLETIGRDRTAATALANRVPRRAPRLLSNRSVLYEHIRGDELMSPPDRLLTNGVDLLEVGEDSSLVPSDEAVAACVADRASGFILERTTRDIECELDPSMDETRAQQLQRGRDGGRER